MASTCPFSARPFPVTAFLIVAGLYSKTRNPERPSAASTTPRAWASWSADRALTPWKGASTAATEGACFSTMDSSSV